MADEEKEGEKKEDSNADTLESVIKESKSLLNLGLAAAVPFAFGGSQYFGSALISSGTNVIVDKTRSWKDGIKYTAANARDSSLAGATMAVPFQYTLNTINLLPLNTTIDYLIMGAAAGGLAIPALWGLYQFANYAIKNKKIAGLRDYFKENYSIKKAWKPLLASTASLLFLPPGLQLPALALVFGYGLSPKKGEVPEERKRDKTPYLTAASSLVKKTYDTAIKEPFYGLKRIADRIGEYTSKPAAKPAEQPSS